MKSIKLFFAFSVVAFRGFSQWPDTVVVDRLYASSKKYWYTNRDSAIVYLKKADSLATQLNYVRGKGYALYGLGWHEKKLYKQFQWYTSALAYFEKCHDQFGLGVTLNAIGLVYRLIGDEPKAIDYTLRSIEFKKKTNDFGGLGFSYINLGLIYFKQKKYVYALTNFQRALEFRIKAGEVAGIAYAHINIAQTFFEQGQWKEAMPEVRAARQQFLSSVDSAGKIWSSYLYGLLLIKEEKVDSAILVLEPIAKIKSNWQYNERALSAKWEYIQLLKQQKKMEQVVQLQEQYLIAKDTLIKRDSRIETQKLANEFEFKVAQNEKEHQETLLAAQMARRNNLQYLFITVLVFIIFVTLFSVKKMVSEKMLSAILFLGLLLFFEFVLVISDPLIEGFSGNQPLLKLLSNVGLALVILPLHNFLEKLTRKKLFRQPAP